MKNNVLEWVAREWELLVREDPTIAHTALWNTEREPWDLKQEENEKGGTNE